MAPYVANTHSSTANPQVVSQLCTAARGGVARPGLARCSSTPPVTQATPNTHVHKGKGPTVRADRLHLWLDKERRRCTRWNVPPALQASTPESAHVCRRPPTIVIHDTPWMGLYPQRRTSAFCGSDGSSEDVKKESCKRAKLLRSVSDFR